MALVRANAEATDNDEYDLRVGIDWTGEESLSILTRDQMGFVFFGSSTPLHRYTPVKTTVDALGSDPDFLEHIQDLVRDCLNQGGISNLRVIRQELDSP